MDLDAFRDAYDARNRAAAADARAEAVSISRDQLRADVVRLEKEVVLATAIARETVATLVSLDGERASRCVSALVVQYDSYLADARFPNVNDLLASLRRRVDAKAPLVMAENRAQTCRLPR